MDAAENTGDGLVVTYDAIKKTWNQRSIEKLKNMDITITNSLEEINGDGKSYEIEVLFNNKNSNADSMGLDEMTTLNYLVACDKDDIVYPVSNMDQTTLALPRGKSEATLIVNVKKDVEIKYLTFVDKKLAIK